MGVDATIRLPEDVRVTDVADVMGILAGLPFTQEPLTGGGSYVKVKGVKVETSGCPEMVIIQLTGNLVDGEPIHTAFYHFESDDGKGRQVGVRSTPFWIALGRQLAAFFGGSMDYNDCDEVDVNYVADKPRADNRHTSNGAWVAFQEDLAKIQPLTEYDLNRAREFAAYK
jgi:hypothetical protein